MVAVLHALQNDPHLNFVAYVLGIALAAAAPEMIEATAPVHKNGETIVVTSHTGLVNALEGIAIKGYDLVAYFTEGKPILGDPKISAEFDGANWWFTTAEHRDAFLAQPTRYDPNTAVSAPTERPRG